MTVPLPGKSSKPKSVSQTLVSRPDKGPSYVDIPLTGMRLTIAKRLTESKVNNLVLCIMHNLKVSYVFRR